MKVVTPTPPAERKTQVELNDKEIALVTYALYIMHEDASVNPGNDDLWGAFDNIRHDLSIERL